MPTDSLAAPIELMRSRWWLALTILLFLTAGPAKQAVMRPAPPEPARLVFLAMPGPGGGGGGGGSREGSVMPGNMMRGAAWAGT
jgi:hypothetical protein